MGTPGYEIRDYVFRSLVNDLSYDNPVIAKLFSSERWKSIYYSTLNERYHDRIPEPYARGFEDQCKGIEPLVKREFENRPHLNAPAERANTATLVAQCGNCHDGPQRTGPNIPFKSTSDLRTWLKEAKNRDALFRRVVTERTMPPGGLSDYFTRKIKKEVRGLLK